MKKETNKILMDSFTTTMNQDELNERAFMLAFKKKALRWFDDTQNDETHDLENESLESQLDMMSDNEFLNSTYLRFLMFTTRNK